MNIKNYLSGRLGKHNRLSWWVTHTCEWGGEPERGGSLRDGRRDSFFDRRCDAGQSQEGGRPEMTAHNNTSGNKTGDGSRSFTRYCDFKKGRTMQTKRNLLRREALVAAAVDGAQFGRVSVQNRLRLRHLRRVACNTPTQKIISRLENRENEDGNVSTGSRQKV